MTSKKLNLNGLRYQIYSKFHLFFRLCPWTDIKYRFLRANSAKDTTRIVVSHHKQRILILIYRIHQDHDYIMNNGIHWKWPNSHSMKTLSLINVVGQHADILKYWPMYRWLLLFPLPLSTSYIQTGRPSACLPPRREAIAETWGIRKAIPGFRSFKLREKAQTVEHLLLYVLLSSLIAN